MSVHLDPKWQAELQRLVDDGHFETVDEAVNEAVSLLLDDEGKLEALRKHVREAVERGGRLTAEEILAKSKTWFDDLDLEEN